MSVMPNMRARVMGKAVRKPMHMVRFLDGSEICQSKPRENYSHMAKGMFFPGRGISSAICIAPSVPP